VVALEFIFAAVPAQAATFEVTDNSDEGPGSLRDAIAQANSTAESSTIQISVQGSIALLSPLPNLAANIAIIGPGADKLAILPTAGTSAASAPIFTVNGNAVVSITGLTLKQGRNGAVENHGNLGLIRCVLSENRAPQAGGAVSNFGDLVVRQSTLSDNIAEGNPGFGGDAFGGAIFNFSNLWVISSTISGNTVFGSDGVSGEFLTRKNSGIADQTDSDLYYNIVDPNTSRLTLGDWWQTNGFNPADGSADTEVKAAYLNDNDLGFGRDMHILQQGNNVASYVSNYSLSLHGAPDQNPLSADAAQAKDPARAIATVCMEYSPIDNDPTDGPIVKFFVYNGTGPDAPRVGGADLDGNGQKFTPQLCMTCHGGIPPPTHNPTLSSVLNMHSSFREFDIAGFKFPRPGAAVDDPSRSVPTASEEQAFKDLNQLVLNTNPASAIQELINGWYAGNASTQDTGFVPDGWGGKDATLGQSVKDLYQKVVATSCRTCHVAQGLDFASYNQFKTLRTAIQVEVLGAAKAMPHAKVTFANFWRTGRQNDLATFSGPNWTPIGTGNITAAQGGSPVGGGIYNQGSLTVVNSTVALNTAVAGIGAPAGSADGGGVAAGGSTQIGNSLVANNFAFNALCGSQDVSDSAVSQGFNLFGNVSAATLANLQSSDLANIPDPQIGTLAITTGTTPTHALLPGSPAIDQGGAATDPITGDPITRDQRGYVFANFPDIGAFEFGGTIPHSLGNISTRGLVQTGNDVMIVGIIITGDGPKKVILRALGPTLSNFHISNPLANPRLDLFDASAALIASNDNWDNAPNQQAIIDSGRAPPSNLESAILLSLNPGNYTAIVRGVNNGTGVALVEGYDLDDTAGSKFGNLSTRGFVQTGNNILIAGIIAHGPDNENVIIRGLGPTLGQPPFNVPDALADPTLELRDINGNLLFSNNNWKETQQSEIEAAGFAPPDDSEAAILATLAPNNYTALLRGQNNATGNALVEVYELN
jgi:hypothetical protein